MWVPKDNMHPVFRALLSVKNEFQKKNLKVQQGSKMTMNNAIILRDLHVFYVTKQKPNKYNRTN